MVLDCQKIKIFDAAVLGAEIDYPITRYNQFVFWARSQWMALIKTSTDIHK